MCRGHIIMIPMILVCFWEMCMKAPFVKILLKRVSVRVTQWIYVERCHNFHVVTKNAGIVLRAKFWGVGQSNVWRKVKDMEIILKNVTIFFLTANRNKCFLLEHLLLAVFFFFSLGFFPTFFCIYWKQGSLEWIGKEEEVIPISCREIGKLSYIRV